MTPTKKHKLDKYLRDYRRSLIDFMRSSECLDSQVLDIYTEIDRISYQIEKLSFVSPNEVVEKYKHVAV